MTQKRRNDSKPLLWLLRPRSRKPTKTSTSDESDDTTTKAPQRRPVTNAEWEKALVGTSGPFMGVPRWIIAVLVSLCIFVAVLGITLLQVTKTAANQSRVIEQLVYCSHHKCPTKG